MAFRRSSNKKPQIGGSNVTGGYRPPTKPGGSTPVGPKPVGSLDSGSFQTGGYRPPTKPGIPGQTGGYRPPTKPGGMAPAGQTPAQSLGSGGFATGGYQPPTRPGGLISGLISNAPADGQHTQFDSPAGVATILPGQSAGGAGQNLIAMTGYNATTGSVGDDALVEERLANMLDKDSVTMQRARARGMQHAASRGLVNSTMAGTAMEAAAIDAALPVASQDASALNTQNLTNQTAQNQASQFNAQQQLTAATQSAEMQQQNQQFNAQQAQAASTYNAGQLNAFEAQRIETDAAAFLKGLDDNAAMELERMSQQFTLLRERTEMAGQMHSLTMQSIGNVLNNPDLTPQQQAAALSEIRSRGNYYASVIGALNGTASTGQGQTPASAGQSAAIPQEQAESLAQWGATTAQGLVNGQAPATPPPAPPPTLQGGSSGAVAAEAARLERERLRREEERRAATLRAQQAQRERWRMGGIGGAR